ncbi:hypothetical protein P3X46_012078 [Hevea brasiliensis]|uniref:Uncharacterized protein n=1 Tax=Hevea brasiliensis TaxID=3981 RepID=A0ABQ9M9H7_HEVBR|nr:hypothetical protein P3X46_012078 [Hevea brasiliensis]
MGESQPTNPLNQTDLQVAMDDMRTSSYHGFTAPKWGNNFVDDQCRGLSKAATKQDNILTSQFPSEILLTPLLHFPSGTQVSSGVPNKMLRITNSGRSGLSTNNARVVTPNVCLTP